MPAPATAPADTGQPAGIAAGAPAEPPAAAAYAAPQPYGYGGVPQPMAGGDQLAALLQALRLHQIPGLPGPAQPAPVAPVAAVAPAPAQTDALGLLRTILTNPQLQQSLRPAAATAAAVVPRTVQLPVPATAAPGQVRSVPIPLGAVLNAIAALAGQSMTEVAEDVSEEEPEVPAYLVDDDGDFVVDPASSDDRAALVAHLFRLSDEAYRSGRYSLNSRPREPAGEADQCDEWAREAGFP